ncbi:hypothetical protein Nepgr_029524 [Nepenthes gracilis]|uniref:Uncharacterized protein n=1 Tax=Nepenthes gracilis TaxID=150966 RepID=A0AAD3TF32_NEPGR|nr:hypothetical protein Nepgr_029524 [Nepenthes gracilis]
MCDLPFSVVLDSFYTSFNGKPDQMSDCFQNFDAKLTTFESCGVLDTWFFGIPCLCDILIAEIKSILYDLLAAREKLMKITESDSEVAVWEIDAYRSIVQDCREISPQLAVRQILRNDAPIPKTQRIEFDPG